MRWRFMYSITTKMKAISESIGGITHKVCLHLLFIPTTNEVLGGKQESSGGRSVGPGHDYK